MTLLEVEVEVASDHIRDGNSNCSADPLRLTELRPSHSEKVVMTLFTQITGGYTLALQHAETLILMTLYGLIYRDVSCITWCLFC